MKDVFNELNPDVRSYITTLSLSEEKVLKVKTIIPSFFRYSAATGWEMEVLEVASFELVCLPLSNSTIVGIVNDVVTWMAAQVPASLNFGDLMMVIYNKGEIFGVDKKGETLTWKSWEEFNARDH